MDPNTINPYNNSGGGMPSSNQGVIPQYPNTSQIYDPLEGARPKPAWQQAIYDNLSNQYQAPAQPQPVNTPPVGVYDNTTQPAPVAQPQSYATAPPVEQFAAPPVQQPVATAAPPQPSPHATYASIADSTSAPLGNIPLTDDYNMESHSQGGTKKTIIMIVGGILAIGILVGGGIAVYQMGYKQGSEVGGQQGDSGQTDEQPRGGSDAEDEVTVPELNFTLHSPTYAEEYIEGAMGEQLDASDGLVVNLYNVDMDYVPEAGGQAALGGAYVKVDFVLGNADSNGAKTINTSMFQLVDELGELVAPLDPSEDGLGSLGSVSLNPGMKSRLSAVYDVSHMSSADNVQIVRSQDYRSSGQIRTVAMSIYLVGMPLSDTSSFLE